LEDVKQKLYYKYYLLKIETSDMMRSHPILIWNCSSITLSLKSGIQIHLFMQEGSSLTLQAFGHRGAAGHAPENTLASFQMAMDLGVDWIELDVQRVEDALIVFHDSRLDRTTNGTGLVANHSLASIRALDVGNGECVPLLEEVFDLMNHHCGINIELKGANTAKLTVEMSQRYIQEEGWRPDQILISSFDLDQLAEVRKYSVDLQIALLYQWPRNRFIEQALELKATAIHIPERFSREHTIANIHANHMKVHVYTVDAINRILKLKHMGVDGIFSNFPERIIKARDIV